MTYEVFYRIAISLIILVTSIAFIWSLTTIHRGRGWNTAVVKLDGTISRRFDWTLVKDICNKTLTFCLRLILSVNIIGYFMFNKWVFGENMGLGGITLVVYLLLYDAINPFYQWTKDESEKIVL